MLRPSVKKNPVIYTGSARARGLLPYKRTENLLYDHSSLVTPETSDHYPVIADYKSLAPTTVTGVGTDGSRPLNTKSHIWRDVENSATPINQNEIVPSLTPSLPLQCNYQGDSDADAFIIKEVRDGLSGE